MFYFVYCISGKVYREEMASKPTPVVATCDTHLDKKAAAFCLKKYELLCVSCIVDKAKSGDCDIQEIDDIRSERHQCILEHLYARQMLKQLSENKDKQLSRTQQLKEKLLEDIDDLHKELSSQIDEKTRICKVLINKNACTIEQEIISESKYIDDHEKQLKTNLEKLKAEDVNIKVYNEEVTSIKEQLIKASNEKRSEPEGSFKPNKKLSECIKRENIGIAYLINQKHYDDVGDPSDNDVLTEHDGSDRFDEICTGSDQVIYSRGDLQQTVKDVTTEQETNSSQSSEKMKDSKGLRLMKFIKGEKKPARKENTQQSSTRRPLSDLTKKACSAEYVAVTLPQSSPFKIGNAVNKKLSIPDLTPNCTKLVYLGENYLGLLNGSLVLVTELPNGPTLRKEFTKQVTSVVSIGSRRIAVLAGEQIIKLGLQDGKLTNVGSFVVQGTIADVTGFDYDVKSSKYAISTSSKVDILDKVGKIIKSCGINANPDATDSRSVYDFESDNVIYMNMRKGTLKALVCKKKDAVVVWKKKCEENFSPRDISLYEDKFCVASKSSIAVFSAKTGMPELLHETYDILPDCLAVCVTNNIAMWTCGMNDKDRSTSIGFVSITTSK